MYPFIHLGAHLKLPTYLLVISFAYCFCLFLLIPRAKKLEMNKNIALDLALILMASGFLGARLLHIVYEEPAYYLEDPMQIFYFWNGGFVFLGGLIVSIPSCYLYLKIKKLSFLKWADFYAPFAPLGYAIGRFACFLNGCCYGKTCELPWAIEFSHLEPQGVGRHPTQLYIIFWEIALLILILNINKIKKLKTGSFLFVWLFLSSVGRVFMEFYRDDQRGDFIFTLSISTWISLILILISGFALIKLNKTNQQKM